MGAVAEEAGIPYARPKQHGIAAGAARSALASAVLVIISLALAIPLKPVFLFVSLGPIIYEFIERPLARASSPRSTIVANAIALLVGYSMLAIFRQLHEPSTLQEGVTVVRGCAVVCGLAITAGLLVMLSAVHPPAASTFLLVVLGIIPHPLQLVYVFLTIVLITIAAWILNRLAGIPVPVWKSSKPPPYEDR